MRSLVPLAVVLTLVAGTAGPAAAAAPPADPPKQPVAQGYGGAVSTVDPTATAAGLEVLRRGGNAVDAAVAAAATLGVTEPFSAGIGGGGFFVFYNARRGEVETLDGRETAPASMRATTFINPGTGLPMAFSEGRVSGLSVGVPGTLATWDEALSRWGSRSLASALAPAIAAARDGFVVDDGFRAMINDNLTEFSQFAPTRQLYLPGGAPPAAGTVLRNPDLAATYQQIADDGPDAFYRGPIGADLIRAVNQPPVAADRPSWPYPIRPGAMTATDLAGYAVNDPAPTHSRYRGLDIYGMATPSSGGQSVGEALNILEQGQLAGQPTAQVLHRYLEASALAFADRNRYVGADTPRALINTLLSDPYAASRACLINPTKALAKPVAPGIPGSTRRDCPRATAAGSPTEGLSTTHLTVADKWGNVVAYTLTIEQYGGSGIVVPGRGFLLNNELTDFNFVGTQGDAADPNLPAPGKRPRSSMAPTIVLRDGEPFLALGSPGGSTIITTVLQILVGRIDLGLSLPAALAAPRATQRNTAAVEAESAFLASPEAEQLRAWGHTLAVREEIGAATALEFGPRGLVTAVAEPVRRGGGAAAVVHPRPVYQPRPRPEPESRLDLHRPAGVS